MDLPSRLRTVIQDLSARRARVAVAVDGPDAAGKTVIADRVAAALPGVVLRASIDGFHRPKAARWQRGSLSSEGYYRDSFDDAALRLQLVEPFLSGAPTVRTAIYDHRRDAPLHGAVVRVPQRAVLVVDGVFLLRPELRDAWSLSVYLHVSPEESMQRALHRDGEVLGTQDLEQRYRERYLPGQQLYRDSARPEAVAHVVVDMTDAGAPLVTRWRPPAPHKAASAATGQEADVGDAPG